jgi:hypothetical protein
VSGAGSVFGNIAYFKSTLQATQEMVDQGYNMTGDITFVIDNVRILNNKPTPDDYKLKYGAKPPYSVTDLSKSIQSDIE